MMNLSGLQGPIRRKCTTKRLICIVIVTFLIAISAVQFKHMNSLIMDKMEPKVYEHCEEKFRDENDQIPNVTDKTIAIGGGITTRGLKGITAINMVSKLPLFKSLLPSFCKTASKGFSYHFYLAHDHNDPYFSLPHSHEMFIKEFNNSVEKGCPSDIQVRVHLVRCCHAAKPAWAQNDAMWEAYLDDIPFFYRINDDSDMLTVGWSEVFIDTLSKYNPPYVGVVGPDHSGGNTAILTYDFTHKTHMDIFGMYYPRVFTDWFADEWVTKVYHPDHSSKRKDIKLKHTEEAGRRYDLHLDIKQKLQTTIESTQRVLKRYIEYRNSKEPTKDPNKQKIISMALYRNRSASLFGAIRNAQLTPVNFPGWTARFYIEKPSGKLQFNKIPANVISKLKHLGAQISYVDTQVTTLSPELWPYLASDDSTVERFIIRNVSFRITDREFTAIEEWIKSNRTFHCIRDHPSHITPIIPDLIGGVNFGINTLFSGSWRIHLGSQGFLNNLWDQYNEHFYCHDSFTCKSQPESFPFITPREGDTFIGQTYDGYQQAAIPNETEVLTKAELVPACLDPKSSIDKVGPPENVHIVPIHPVFENAQLVSLATSQTTNSSK